MNATTNNAVEVVHLSEEQIDDQLLGDLSKKAAEHLAECGECSQRVAEAAAPMAHFRDVTMAWSERRSATMSIPSVPAEALAWQRRMGWAMTACALVVGISFTGNGRKAEMLRASVQSAQSVDAASAASALVAVPVASGAGENVSAEKYSGDNRMLKAIDNELDASVETPAAMGLEQVSDKPSGQSSPSQIQD